MALYKPGDIVFVDLGLPPDQVIGHEQGHTRPCVIVRPFPALKLAVVLPITSQSPNYAHYTVVSLRQGVGGLSKDSFVLCHQIRTISFERIINKTGFLGEFDLLKIKSVLMDTLDI